MKLFRIAIAAVFALGAGSAYAFHSGGVAECGGCHNMHAPADGANGYLLIGATASETCLSCHASADTAPTRYHVMTYPTGGVLAATVPVERGAGGDFAWLAISTTWSPRAGTTNTIAGQERGHNIVATNYGISADTVNLVAPGGGTLAAANFGCNSCHDPHGKLRRIGSGTNGDQTFSWARTGAPIAGSGSYSTSIVPTATAAVGEYRILRGAGDTDAGTITAVPASGFGGIFQAVAPNSPSYAWNSSEATAMNRVAYSADLGVNTVGRWCASCHPDMHSTGTTQPLVHPIDQGLGTGIANNYNAYVSSGIMTNTSTTSFLSLVPFAQNTNDYGVLKAAAVKAATSAGPAANDQVMCLSCHRAHASGFKYMLRWDYEAGEFLTFNDAGTTNWGYGNSGSGLSLAQTNAAYQDIPASNFGLYQRQLCNKCHAKD